MKNIQRSNPKNVVFGTIYNKIKPNKTGKSI